jgi:enoyl-CoA hydratase/carnithine racemase
MANDQWVRLEQDDGVATIVFDRAPVNAFDTPFLTQVLDALRTLGEETRAVVVTSAVPSMFAAGGDIPGMARASLEELLPFVKLCQESYSAFERLHCPTVAAIDGPCMGGGFELALACDIRVAGSSALLALPEATIGLIASGGGTQRLVRAVGQGVARDLLLTGRRISGEEAGALGIVSRVVAPGEAEAEALAIARKLADGPTEAIEATKRLAVAASELAMEEGSRREFDEWAKVRPTAATQEGLDAFAEKRRPDFQGARRRAALGRSSPA